MELINVFIILIILSLDCFVVVMEKGAVMPYLSWKKIIQYSTLFGIVSLIMFLLGFFVGGLFTFSIFRQINRMILAMLFILMGSHFLYNAFSRGEFIERLDKNIDLKHMARLALTASTASIDLFLLGVSIHIVGVDIKNMAILTTLVTFLFVFIGLKIGQMFGVKYQKQVYCLSGVLLYISSLVLVF